MKYSHRIILEELSHGAWQRIDGLRCAPKVIDLSNFSFRWELRWLRWRSLIERFYWTGIVPWRRFPAFRITEKGKTELKSETMKMGEVHVSWHQ